MMEFKQVTPHSRNIFTQFSEILLKRDRKIWTPVAQDLGLLLDPLQTSVRMTYQFEKAY